MEIKVGDKVRVSKDAPGIYMKTIFPNLVSSNMEVTEIGYGFARIKPLICECEYLTFEFAIPTKYLIKVEDEAKEPKPKYKAGDKVRVLGHALLEGCVFTITLVEHREKRGWIYRINTHTWFPESDLERYTEPTTPTIKVGDFVRVLENLHEPICLDVERDLEITNVPPHAVSQKEWKVISVEMRRDCAGRIYTLKHDDSFIYNIPEDCVELVQPTEPTEKKPNIGSIRIPVEVDLTDGFWDTYTADLAKEIAVKSMEKSYGCDPERIADYAVSVAKAVVENLKKK